MKIRRGFVSNSSSSSFTILNKTDKDMTLREFFLMYELEIKEFIKKESYLAVTDWNELLVGAERLGVILPAGQTITQSFTNESGNPTDGFLRTFLEWQSPFDTTGDGAEVEWKCIYNSQTADWNDYE